MLASWKKRYDKTRQHVKKQRHHFAEKCLFGKSSGFSSSHVQIKSWTIKKAECQRIDTFQWWCWRRLVRILWATRESNQSILKEINPEYSLEGLLLSLKLQYFGRLMQRVDSLEKTLMLGKTEGRTRRGTTKDEMVGWHHRLHGHEFEQTPRDSEEQRILVCCCSWASRVRHDLATE